MKQWFRQLFCKHKWEWYVVPEKGKFKIVSGEERVLGCAKCKKIKKGSNVFIVY